MSIYIYYAKYYEHFDLKVNFVIDSMIKFIFKSKSWFCFGSGKYVNCILISFIILSCSDHLQHDSAGLVSSTYSPTVSSHSGAPDTHTTSSHPHHSNTGTRPSGGAVRPLPIWGRPTLCTPLSWRGTVSILLPQCEFLLIIVIMNGNTRQNLIIDISNL